MPAILLLLLFFLPGCFGGKKAIKQDQSYTISFQKQDKFVRNLPAKYTWQESKAEVAAENYVRGEIKGIANINELSKLKEMIETLKFAVMQYDVGQSSEPPKAAN